MHTPKRDYDNDRRVPQEKNYVEICRRVPQEKNYVEICRRVPQERLKEKRITSKIRRNPKRKEVRRNLSSYREIPQKKYPKKD